MFRRSRDTGVTTPVENTESIFQNMKHKETLKRMLTIHPGIEDEVYITIRNVPVLFVNGTPILAKVIVGICENEMLQQYYKTLTRLYTPHLTMTPFPVNQATFTLKKKWYRAFHSDGTEFDSTEDVGEFLKNGGAGAGTGASESASVDLEIHLNAIRTHGDKVLFQPMIRKIRIL